MAYDIQKSDGTTLVILEDGFKDNSTSLTLVGRNYLGYGSYQNQNFLYLLENFSKLTSPVNPVQGQLWFDKNVQRLKVFSSSNSWNQIPSVTYGSTVTNQVNGDLWFNNSTDELYVRSGSGYLKIGPYSSVDSADTLTTGRTINGVVFNGSANITLSSTTTNYLINGNYLTGNDFNGATTQTWAVDVGTVTVAQPSKVVARDSNGDIWFTVGHGHATSADYADLAEKYVTDKEYEVGTVVSVGGLEEVTECKEGDRAIGVVSLNPAYMMNATLENGTYIALKGRVPVKISNDVKKGQKLIAGNNGCALATNEITALVFGIALKDGSAADGFVEAIIL
jgi:hypothetical protein